MPDPPKTWGDFASLTAIVLAVWSAVLWIANRPSARDHAEKLGSFRVEGQQLGRDSDNEFVDFPSTQMKCDSWATEVEAYLQKHFGSGASAE
jgi:hypothetical protein